MEIRLTFKASVLNVCLKMTEELDEGQGTRERILSAAEALFAERGFDTVSLRDITGAADANVAAVNYHFGSKDKLIDAVIEHRVCIRDLSIRIRGMGHVEKEALVDTACRGGVHRSGRIAADGGS